MRAPPIPPPPQPTRRKRRRKSLLLSFLGFALSAGVLVFLAGTGVDIRLNPAFALRLASVEYARSWAPSVSRSYNQGLQLSTGMILRMGTW